jgi:hypothetical protein
MMVVALLLLPLCRCTKTVYVPVHSTTTVTEVQRDTTVEIRLTPYRDSTVVADTVSRLENSYAYSEARWLSGRLSHTLGIKSVPIPVKVHYKEILRTDSIHLPVPVPGAEKIVYRLRWWQEALVWMGVLFLLLCVWKIARYVI